MSKSFTPDLAGRTQWAPSADIYRTRQGWVIKFDLAGVRPEDVRLACQGTTVHISGARRDWILQKGWNYYSMEISYSHFERAIELPCNLEGAHFHSEFRDGMLLIHITIQGEER